MKDNQKNDRMGTLGLPIMIPLMPLMGFHILLLSIQCSNKLRIPYIISMPFLFAIQILVIDLTLFHGCLLVAMLLSHGIFLCLAFSLTLIMQDRNELQRGPDNFEGFAAIHMLFVVMLLVVKSFHMAT